MTDVEPAADQPVGRCLFGRSPDGNTDIYGGSPAWRSGDEAVLGRLLFDTKTFPPDRVPRMAKRIRASASWYLINWTGKVKTNRGVDAVVVVRGPIQGEGAQAASLCLLSDDGPTSDDRALELHDVGRKEPLPDSSMSALTAGALDRRRSAIRDSDPGLVARLAWAIAAGGKQLWLRAPEVDDESVWLAVQAALQIVPSPLAQWIGSYTSWAVTSQDFNLAVYSPLAESPKVKNLATRVEDLEPAPEAIALLADCARDAVLEDPDVSLGDKLGSPEQRTQWLALVEAKMKAGSNPYLPVTFDERDLEALRSNEPARQAATLSKLLHLTRDRRLDAIEQVIRFKKLDAAAVRGLAFDLALEEDPDVPFDERWAILVERLVDLGGALHIDDERSRRLEHYLKVSNDPNGALIALGSLTNGDLSPTLGVYLRDTLIECYVSLGGSLAELKTPLENRRAVIRMLVEDGALGAAGGTIAVLAEWADDLAASTDVDRVPKVLTEAVIAARESADPVAAAKKLQPIVLAFKDRPAASRHLQLAIAELAGDAGTIRRLLIESLVAQGWPEDLASQSLEMHATLSAPVAPAGRAEEPQASAPTPDAGATRGPDDLLIENVGKAMKRVYPGPADNVTWTSPWADPAPSPGGSSGGQASDPASAYSIQFGEVPKFQAEEELKLYRVLYDLEDLEDHEVKNLLNEGYNDRKDLVHAARSDLTAEMEKLYSRKGKRSRALVKLLEKRHQARLADARALQEGSGQGKEGSVFGLGKVKSLVSRGGRDAATEDVNQQGGEEQGGDDDPKKGSG